MSETGKSASSLRGIPAAVIALFENMRPVLEVFASHKHLELVRFDRAAPNDTKWAWNLYGKCWGRKICIQVLIDGELAIAGKALLHVFIGPIGAVTEDRPWKHYWTERIESAERAILMLNKSVAELADICKGMPCNHTFTTPAT